MNYKIFIGLTSLCLVIIISVCSSILINKISHNEYTKVFTLTYLNYNFLILLIPISWLIDKTKNSIKEIYSQNSYKINKGIIYLIILLY